MSEQLYVKRQAREHPLKNQETFKYRLLKLFYSGAACVLCVLVFYHAIQHCLLVCLGGGIARVCGAKNYCVALETSATGRRRSGSALVVLFSTDLICCRCYIIYLIPVTNHKLSSYVRCTNR
jgi:hypothetical protein